MCNTARKTELGQQHRAGNKHESSRYAALPNVSQIEQKFIIRNRNITHIKTQAV